MPRVFSARLVFSRTSARLISLCVFFLICGNNSYSTTNHEFLGRCDWNWSIGSDVELVLNGES